MTNREINVTNQPHTYTQEVNDSYSDAIIKYIEDILSDSSYIYTDAWADDVLLTYRILNNEQRQMLIALTVTITQYIDSILKEPYDENTTSLNLFTPQYNIINTTPPKGTIDASEEIYIYALKKLRESYTTFTNQINEILLLGNTSTPYIVVSYLLLVRRAIFTITLNEVMLNNTFITSISAPNGMVGYGAPRRKKRTAWNKKNIDNDLSDICRRLSLVESFDWVTATLIKIMLNSKDTRSKYVTSIVYALETIGEVEDGIVFNDVGLARDVNEHLAIISGKEYPEIGIYGVVDVVTILFKAVSMYRYAPFNILMSYRNTPINKVLLWTILDHVDEVFEKITD